MASKKMTDAQRARLNRRRSAARWKSKGLDNKEIAAKLNVSAATVRNDLNWIEENEPSRLNAGKTDSAANAEIDAVEQVPAEATTVDEAAPAESAVEDAYANAVEDSIAVDADSAAGESAPVETSGLKSANAVEDRAGEVDEAQQAATGGVESTDGDEKAAPEDTVDGEQPNTPSDSTVTFEPVTGTKPEAARDQDLQFPPTEEMEVIDHGAYDGDVRKWWAANSTEVEDKTGEMDYFLELDDKGKWDYLVDRVRNDKVECAAIAFIVVAVIMFLLSL